MSIRNAVVSTILALVAVGLVATPAAAKSNNLLAAAGVSFAPAKVTPADAQPAATDLTPRMKFETPAVMANVFLPRGADDPHKMGIGVRVGGYTYGPGLLFRYWFSDVIFFDIGFSHHGYFTYLSYNTFSGTVFYNFKTIDTSDIVTVRIYAGGGVTISRWSYDPDIYGPGLSSTSIGGHGLVGAELIFKQFPKLGVGADAGFYSSQNDFNVVGYGGFGSAFYAIWYFK